MAAEAIRETTLRELAEAKSIRSISAVGQHGGFAVSVRYGTVQRSLSSARGDIRLFPNLTTLATFLQKFGITRFEVDTSRFEPGRIRPARPDRAEALRHTRTKRQQASLFEVKP
jgi:hypothetical protein